jgi:hypothetical protein
VEVHRRRASAASPTRTSNTPADTHSPSTTKTTTPASTSARSADLLEVVTIVRDDGSQLAIHAMKMWPKYRRLLLGG